MISISKKILILMRETKKRYFSISELASFLDENQETLRVTLSRMARRKLILRLTRGYYCLPEKTPDLEQLAIELTYPSYISLEYALAVHGILSQVPAVITLVSPLRSAKYSIGETVVEIAHIKHPLFFGYKIRQQIQIARPEKALLDELYLMGIKKRELDIRELNTHGVNKKLFNKWLSFYPPSTRKVAATHPRTQEILL